MKKRILKFSSWLEKENIDFAVLTSSENVFYFTNYLSDPHERLLALIFYPDGECLLICPEMETGAARKAGYDKQIIGYDDTEDPWEKIKKATGKKLSSVRRIAVEKSHMNIERFEILRKLYPSAHFVRAEEKLNELRMIKDEDELKKLKKACEIADFAIQAGINELKEGTSELAIVAAIEYELKKKGIHQMSFPTTVLTGPKAAMPHGTPDLTEIRKGEFVLFDLGVVYEGYCSDITRTIAFGDVGKEHSEIYETVKTAQMAAIQTAKPGVTCERLDETARNIIRDAGYGPYFTHRLGHGLGINIHEYPSVTGKNPLCLREGMVFTVEPGIYIPGKTGVRIEDVVAVTKDGVEVLTNFPKELQIVT